jgi:hypothetical protein
MGNLTRIEVIGKGVQASIYRRFGWDFHIGHFNHRSFCHFHDALAAMRQRCFQCPVNDAAPDEQRGLWRCVENAPLACELQH